MSKYICLTPIEAMQWNNPGDHPKVVFDEERKRYMLRATHAFWNTTTINPGDYIIEKKSKKLVVVKKDKFEAMYKKID